MSERAEMLGLPRSTVASRLRRALSTNGRENARLVAALRDQDPAVAAPLFERFAPMILRLLRQTLGPRAPIGCGVEVVLLCVFHSARRLRPRSDLQRFIVRATARVARAELRKQARPPAAPEGPSSKRQAVVRLYRILGRLNAADRIAFVFHYVEGVQLRDVAAALGSTTAATRRRLDRALRAVHDGIRCDPLLRELRGRC
jgi:RNA polymerase sigma-70 factor, ECF subfamily